MDDYDNWMDPVVYKKMVESHGLYWSHRQMGKDTRAELGIFSSKSVISGLCVSVYEPDFTSEAGVPHRDVVYYGGFCTAVLQLAIATIPLTIYGDWSTMLITASGTLLAFSVGGLPQWAREKWSCRRRSSKTFVLVHGNGGQHAIVILGNGHGLDLEDLARSTSRNLASPASQLTIVVLALYAILWTALLITASQSGTNDWYILAVGAIGMIHNLFVVAKKRHPSAFGLHLTSYFQRSDLGTQNNENITPIRGQIPQRRTQFATRFLSWTVKTRRRAHVGRAER
jgi:hypothetical protein